MEKKSWRISNLKCVKEELSCHPHAALLWLRGRGGEEKELGWKHGGCQTGKQAAGKESRGRCSQITSAFAVCEGEENAPGQGRTSKLGFSRVEGREQSKCTGRPDFNFNPIPPLPHPHPAHRPPCLGVHHVQGRCCCCCFPSLFAFVLRQSSLLPLGQDINWV